MISLGFYKRKPSHLGQEQLWDHWRNHIVRNDIDEKLLKCRRRK